MAGRLVTIVGVMGSGKTERLIEIYNTCKDLGMEVSVFKPALDTRSEPFEVKDRSGTSIPAIPIEEIDDLVIYEDSLGQAVFIDEVQFFNQDNVVESIESILVKGLNVYCFGLDLTSEGKTFGKMGEILANSDEVIKLEIKCTYCNNSARVSQYKGEDKKEDVKVGDLDSYEPVCRSCFYGIEDMQETGDTGDILYYEENGDPLYYVEMGDENSGFTMELLIKESSLRNAGYTLNEVKEITTIEGANNLLEDLGMKEEGGGLFE